MPGEQLPDQMTGRDLVIQENHEMNYERELVNNMDRVDRRDKRDEIISFVANKNYLMGYAKINWNG